jgi:hypothetical protein
VAVAQEGRWGGMDGAFAALGVRGYVSYLEALTRWSAAFEAHDKGLSFSVLQEAIRIIAWMNPSWEELYLVSKHDSSSGASEFRGKNIDSPENLVKALFKSDVPARKESNPPPSSDTPSSSFILPSGILATLVRGWRNAVGFLTRQK